MSTVLFIEDVAKELRISRRSIERLRRHGAFPIAPMPSLDKRARWSSEAVEAFKAERDEHAATVMRRRPVRTYKALAGGVR